MITTIEFCLYLCLQLAETKARLEAEAETSAKLRKTIGDLQQVSTRV